jgi:putative ABC transport system permease protein
MGASEHNITPVQSSVGAEARSNFLADLGRDLRYGLRQLRRNPGFTAVAILTLALGIGANTAVFSVANDFLFRPLPFGNSGQVVMVKWHDQTLARSGWFDPPTFRYFQERNQVFENMAAWDDTTHYFNLTGAGGPERVRAKRITQAFFRVLGVEPVLGRPFSSGEERRGERVALISHALWQSRFGESGSILGKTIVLDGKGYTVIGVLPVGFRFSAPPEDVWTPLAVSFNGGGYGGYFLNVIACLKPGVTQAQARANMSAIFRQFAQQFPEWTKSQEIMVESLRDRYDRQIRPALLVLLLAAALVLLITCLNLAGLLVARATSRFKEMAIRHAVGANRGTLIRQMLIESSLLAVLASGGGMLIALAGTHGLYAELPAIWQPLTRGGINSTIFVFALLISLLSLLLFGLAPAWSATGFDLNEGLREGSRSPMAAVTMRSLRSALVVGEVALAVVLLTGTALLIKSFARLVQVNMGFRPEKVLTVSIARTKNHADTFYAEVVRRIAALPQVRAAGAINIMPLSGGGWSQDITIEGRPRRPTGDYIWAAHRNVTLGYFRAMGIPLLKGRFFAATDQDKPVAVISESMARLYWHGQNPIGERFGVNCANTKCNWNTVIGVVRNVKELGAGRPSATTMYFLDTSNDMTLVVRSMGNPANLVSDIRAVIRSTDPEQPLGDVLTMRDVISESLAPHWLTSIVSGLFATLALILATLGLYGVISYSVSQRTREIGIRMALGAQKRGVLGMVVGQGIKLTLIGIAVGLAGALVLTQFLASLLYGIRPNDPVTFIAVSVSLFVVAGVASYIPARRAMAVDPVVALRYE